MNSRTKNNIFDIIKDEVSSHSEVMFAYVFGSFVESDKYNDIDVAIYLQESDITDSRWYEIDFGLKLEKALGTKVDLVILNRAPDHLIHQISKGNLVLDRNEDKRLDFLLPAWKRYFDFKIKREEFIRQIV
jgi:uncharacterized protein